MTGLISGLNKHEKAYEHLRKGMIRLGESMLIGAHKNIENWNNIQYIQKLVREADKIAGKSEEEQILRRDSKDEKDSE